MLTLDEALARLLSAIRPLAETESVSTFDALGRVLAEGVRSGLDVPPQDNTSMDGYALRCADVPAAGTPLTVAQRIPAGHVGQPALAGNTDPQITHGVRSPGLDSLELVLRAAFSSRPETPNRRASSFSTRARGMSRWASRTNRW